MLSLHRLIRFLPTLCLILFLSAAGSAQTARAVASSVRVATVKTGEIARLAGHVPAWATVENDLGSVAPSQQLSNLHLVLTRAPEVQAALTQLLADQQDPASPRFHQWLTPQQNAERYGVAPADVAAVTGWMQSQGLNVDDVALGGLFITFSGAASVVESAFATSLHNFRHQGAARFALTSEPAVPAALAAVIGSVAGLSEQMAQTHSHAAALAEPVTFSGSGVRPMYNSGTSLHYTSPGDFNTIYDITPALSAGYNGSGVRVANIIDSRVAAADITGFNAVFGLNAAQPATIVAPGSTDPGLNGDSEGEATLDAQRILGTAPGAGVDILAVSSLSFANIYSALQYEVGTLNDPVVNMSFGACDSGNVAAQEARFDAYFQAGAAQGISFFVSSGDNAAGGCDGDYNTIPATQALATNVICASSYVTCVGGTEFAEGAGAYWAGANSATKSSATGYIPEGAWNEPTYTASGKTTFQASGTGGGVTKMAKPAWQSGTGVPADGVRDVPDVSFTSAFHDGYLICQADAGNDCSAGTFKYIIFGTSASSPSMAGIAAILNQKLGARQGNLNPLFYKLAATPGNGVFHDVTVTTSDVASCVMGTPSMCNNGTPTTSALTGGLAGYAVADGYDLATGLGSMDVAKFLAAATPVAAPPAPVVTSSLSLTASGNPVTTAQTVSFTATLGFANSTATPAGAVQFYSNGAALGAAVSLGPGATATTPALTFATAGTYVISASYSGDGTFPAAAASGLSLVVDAAAVATPGFTLTTASGSLNFVSGATVANTETMTLASVNGFAGTVTLGCAVSAGSAAVQPACSVSPAAVALGAGGKATAVVTISTAASTSTAGRGMAVTLALLLCLGPWRRRRNLQRLAVVLGVCGALAGISGCGSGVNNLVSTSSSAGTYTVTVTGRGTAAGASTPVTATAVFTVTVQ